MVPSGKLTVCELENHHAIFMGKSTFSIANCDSLPEGMSFDFYM